VPEDASGATVLNRPRTRRAPPHRPTTTLRSIVDGQARLPAPRLAGIVEQLRRADAVARTARRAPVSLRTTAGTAAQAMAVLQQAVRDKSRVWVGYVDAHGGTAARLVRPVSLGAGYLRAEDDRTETLHTFALHRITAAVVDE
jgi:predicted DNA-binding transcriptional regulator YafY